VALRQRTATLGGLSARVVDDVGEAAGTHPACVVVLCHGYGAPGDDLVGLADELCGLAPALAHRARFIFPEAPLALPELPFGGRAWWPIDMVALQRAMMTGEVRRLADETPAGLSSSRQKLMALIDEALRQAQLPYGNLVLGGFSQGAMLATDTTLRLDEAPAALAVLSGTLLSQSDWRRLAPRRAGLEVVMSHGKQDPILPFAGAEALKALLDEAGLKTTLHPFRGGHGIAGNVLAALAHAIERVAT
jgi:phospholipase/carboxylesterase